MAKLVLEVDLRVPEGQEGRAAEAALAQVPPFLRPLLVGFAAAVVTLAEREAASTVLVVPKGFVGRLELPD